MTFLANNGKNKPLCVIPKCFIINKFALLILLLSSSLFSSSQDNPDIKLVKFEPSECTDEVHAYNLNNRIVSIEKHADTTIVEVSVKANCCISINPSIHSNLDTIDLVYNDLKPDTIINQLDTFLTIEEECECLCCFNFRFYLMGLDNDSFTYKTDNQIIEFSKHRYKVIQKPFFKIVDGDTINKVDIYGMKQGLHNYFDSKNRQFRSVIYKDDRLISGLLRRSYTEEGSTILEHYQLKGGSFKTVFFNNKGVAFKECEGFLFEHEDAQCIDLN